jgi:hypothetical protein
MLIDRLWSKEISSPSKKTTNLSRCHLHGYDKGILQMVFRVLNFDALSVSHPVRNSLEQAPALQMEMGGIPS